MKIKDWFKKQATAFTLAMTSVEKNALSQEGTELTHSSSVEKKKQASSLADALIKGEITQEVKELRWRTYKVIKASESNSVKMIPKMIVLEDGTREFLLDEYGSIIFEEIKVNTNNRERIMSGVILDMTDSYPLKLVINNDAITNGIISTNDETALSFKSYLSNSFNERPIKVSRDFIPKFEIENFTRKLIVRTISETEVLLEFYVSKYIDEHNMTNKLFINEINKVINNGPDKINFLEIKEVGFITYNSIGSDDFHAYSFDITSFDKIIEFDGSYVIKFKGVTTLDGLYIMEKYLEEGLEKKYSNKEKKKITI
jgi:hypothetical protein